MKLTRSALLPHSAMQMYEIVADIPSYPSFLNWCDRADVLSDQDQEVIAKLKVAYSKLNIQFTTRNINTPGESIALSLVDGPFSQLEGLWQFQALSDEASKVSIHMDFKFDNSLAPAIFSRVFEKIVSMQLEAFQKRAQYLHG